MTPRTPPRSARAGAVTAGAAAAAAATIAGLFLAPDAGALSGVATGTLVALRVTGVPALNLTAFQGVYGTSSVPALGGDHAGDFSDPDGVLNHVTVSGPVISRSSSTSGRNSAQAQLIGASGASAPAPPLVLKMNGETLFQIGSMDADAECTPPSVGSSALVHVHTDANSVKVLGHVVPLGTTSLPVTGADIGVPAVATGTLTTVYRQVATPSKQTAGLTTASAHIELAFSGTFKDSGGATVYSGPLESLRLGDVTAACPADGPTPTTSTSSAPPPSPTTISTTSGSGAQPATGPTTRHSAKPRPPHPSSHHGGGGGTGSGDAAAGALPSTGGPSGWWPIMSGLGLAFGGGLFGLTRRHGQHQ